MPINCGGGPFVGAIGANGPDGVVPATGYTKCCWVVIDQDSVANNFLSGDNGGGNGHAFWASGFPGNGGKLAAGHNGSYEIVLDPVKLVIGTEYFVRVTYDGTDLRLYKDEVLVAGPTAAANIGGTVKTEIGLFAAGNGLVGRMDDLRCYNRVIADSEGKDIRAARGADSIYSGILARWRFDEGALGAVASGANTLIDITKNGNHATPVNSPTYALSQLRKHRRAA